VSLCFILILNYAENQFFSLLNKENDAYLTKELQAGMVCVINVYIWEKIE